MIFSIDSSPWPHRPPIFASLGSDFWQHGAQNPHLRQNWEAASTWQCGPEVSEEPRWLVMSGPRVSAALPLAFATSHPLHGILLVDTDPSAAATLAHHPPARPTTAPEVFLHIPGSHPGEDLAESIAFLQRHDISPLEILWFHHDGERPTPTWVHHLLGTEPLPPPDRLGCPLDAAEVWAEFLLTAATPFRALRWWLHLWAARDRGETRSGVLRCLDALAIDRSVHFDPQKKTVAISPAAAEGAAWSQNMEALQRRDRDLAELASRHQPQRPLIPAFTDEFRWQARSLQPAHGMYAPYALPLLATDLAAAAAPPPNVLSPRLGSLVARLPELAYQIGVVFSGSLPQADLLNVWRHPPNLAQGMAQGLYLVEPDLDRFQFLLRHVPCADLLADTRTFLFLGARCTRQLTDYFAADSMRQVPVIAANPTGEIDYALRKMRRQRKKKGDQAHQRLEGSSMDRRLEELQAMLGGASGNRMRWMLITTLFSNVTQHCCEEIRKALTRMGHEAVIVKESHPTERLSAQAMLETFLAFEPHVVFCFDHLRPELPFPIPPEIPSIAWIIDDLPHLHEPDLIRQLGPRDLTFVVTHQMVPTYRRLGYANPRALRLAVNLETYRPPSADAQPVQDEVAFACNIGTVAPEPEWAPGFYDWFRNLMEREGITYQDYGALFERARRGIRELGLMPPEPMVAELHRRMWMVEREFHRLQPLRWLIEAGVPLALYGRDWQHHPEMKPHWRGYLEPGPQLAAAYRTSKVHLHINSVLNLHPRIFECLASGGLILIRSCPSDHQPGELNDVLEIHRQVLVFEDRDTLLGMVDRAFSDEDWRRRHIEAGRRVVSESHSYDHRVREMCRDLKEALGSGDGG